MAKPIASARIPHSWDEQIRAIAAERGTTPSDIVKEAIAQYLGKTDPESVAAMARRLSRLEQQYRKLAQLV
jgi:predicted DNA-binding protein